MDDNMTFSIYFIHSFGDINCVGIHLRFGDKKFLLTIPRTKLVAGDNTFYAAALRPWNSLPASLRQCSTTGKFKKALDVPPFSTNSTLGSFKNN